MQATDQSHPRAILRAPRPGPTFVALAAIATAGLLWHMREAAPSTPGPLHTALDSAATTAAMMALLVGESVEFVAERSLPSRRWLTASEHVLGYVALWVAFGLVASGAVQMVALVLS